MQRPCNYIELNRQFVEINEKDVEMSETEARIELGLTSASSWPDLLREHRVVILSSAGTGKTSEILHQCENLHLAGKPTFLLRLEDLATEWGVAFDSGNAENLKKAVRAGDEIWIFLDSIDEARLKDPRDFELALKRLKPHIKDNLQNVHMVLTSRIGAWRPKEDAARLDNLFPYVPPEKSSSDKEEDDDIDIEWYDEVVPDINTPQVEEGNNSSIKYYTPLHLNREQMQIFAKARGLEDASEFVSEIQHPNMQGLATRPKDLDDLILFWRDNGRLGNRWEIIENNIKRKLEEDDQNRAMNDSLFIEKALAGAKKLAAAVALTHHSKVIVPDWSSPGEGISVQSVLADWSAKECFTLLGRPIFEPETYGFVRFDHRDSREFLAANWFFDLIERGQSRMRVEQLFFKTQYGIEVVVPNLRPILPWLAILDHEIRRRVMVKCPEILLEGGDPSELPLSDRKELLERFCVRHATTESRISVDLNALQRLITPELGPAIRKLYVDYEGNEEIEILLLESIELGLLQELADIAEGAALKPSQRTHTRLAAMRALSAVCDGVKIASVCGAILTDNGLASRQELANVLDVFGAKYIPVSSLMHLVEVVEPKERYSSGRLNRAIIEYINTCTINDAKHIVSESARLVKQAPLSKRDFFEISEKNAWMLDFATMACKRLIEERHSAARLCPCLSLLSLTNKSQDYDIRETETNLGELVPQWPELNAALFWYDVEDARTLRDKTKGERLTDWWQVHVFRDLWHFEHKDIDQVVKWITQKEFIDNRLVALTLAFSLYRDAGRPRSLRKRLRSEVEGHAELSATLNRLLKPPAMSDEERRLMRSTAIWKRRGKELKRKDAEFHNKWRKEIANCLEHIRENRVPSEGKIWYAQQYLFDRMRSLGKKRSRWAQPNWQDLEAEVGREAAEAMRSGLMAIWRRYNPTLASEAGECGNSTPVIESMALSGLEIEFRETPGWPTSLDDDEAQRVTRYLMSELNGFPIWFRAVEAKYPDITLSVLLKEAVWELFDNPSDEPSHYLFARILWNASWFGDRIAPHLVPLLLDKEPRHIRVLGYAMPIIMGCKAVENDQIAKLCARKIAETTTPLAHHPLWYAAWVSVDPLSAIYDLTTKLAALEDVEAVEFAIDFINALYGSRHEGGLGVRDGHKTPEHLTNLFVLMHQYIRREDDIDRTKGGVYTPTSRDYAQDARGYIYKNLADIPGKDAFDALVSIAREAPSGYTRDWLDSRVDARAQADADVAWKVDGVNEFADELERTPRSPHELFEVAKNRLVDLKYNYEEGDTSPWNVLIKVDKEVELRNYLADDLKRTARARYSISQEEEMPNVQRTDIRFVRANIPGMVPVELKIADKWSGPELFAKLKDQLCGDYLRDVDSTSGIYLLVHHGKKIKWQHPDSKKFLPFEELIAALQCSAQNIIASCPGITNIEVIGIDLIKRSKSMQK